MVRESVSITRKENEMQINRSNTGALIVGTLLIVFGLMALAGRFFSFVDWDSLWPFAIIGFGALFFVAMFAGGKGTAAFAIPGSIIGGIGLVLLFQNITGHWESMSYFWTLIITFVGVGIYVMGWYSGDENQKRSGWRVMKVGFTLFIIFGVFFETIFSSYSNILFPLLLIALGAYLVLSRSGLLGAKKADKPSEPIEPSDQSIPPAS
jgi:hypothetical protein